LHRRAAFLQPREFAAVAAMAHMDHGSGHPTEGPVRRVSKIMMWKTLALVLVLTGAAADTLAIDKVERSYIVHRPAGLAKTKAVPLVVMLHGALGSGAQAERAYHWNELADRNGFVVVYPDGLNRTWNAGGPCCGPAHRKEHNDVGFLDKLIDSLVKAENIDANRIYMTGMSNGGAMTYRYACEGKHSLAAIGPVAASFTYFCKNAPVLPVIAIHGMDDRTVPFAGGIGKRGRDIKWLPVQASLDVFRDADLCAAPTLAQSGEVVTSTAPCEKGREVVLITVANAGHQWPGSNAEKGAVAKLLLDPPSQAFNASERLWQFFARHIAG
jgi:polyhydroxybutyrate depolymerase